jgi:hypothetical protein
MLLASSQNAPRELYQQLLFIQSLRGARDVLKRANQPQARGEVGHGIVADLIKCGIDQPVS